ncbi:MAG: hypothetical protein IPK16_31975 [Anaerolineales bacterium]|nr:hypothetical protein [Anaerolineales bacterium]
MRAKLLLHPSVGAARGTRIEILDVIREMQVWKLMREVSLVEAGWDPPQMIRDALADGIRTFVVCGGDGTISAVAAALAGIPSNRAALGVIPSGTQNNIALSLDIPMDIPAAIALLRTGRRVKMDIGMATCSGSLANGGEITTPFLELCSVGLISSLFPSADDLQHGNLARAGDFLATLVKSPPAEITLVLNNKEEIRDLGHVVLVCNVPYIGRNYRISANSSYNDGLLDVLFFADLTKLELLNYVFQGVGIDMPEDPHPALSCAPDRYRHSAFNAGHGGWASGGRRTGADRSAAPCADRLGRRAGAARPQRAS